MESADTTPKSESDLLDSPPRIDSREDKDSPDIDTHSHTICAAAEVEEHGEEEQAEPQDSSVKVIEAGASCLLVNNSSSSF